MHFTYESPASDLQQGDVLKRTEPLNQRIAATHASFLKDDYTHFMVITQSCDLVRRAQGPATNYIEICAVRPLSLVIDRYAAALRHGIAKEAGANGTGDRSRVKEFLKRLLNNNVHEYFYLHEDLTVGLPASCSFLRLSVPLKLIGNYEMLLDARVISLKASFQAKLGWLVGDIYSRVGTEDWTDSVTKSDWEKTLDDLLDENVVWLKEENSKAAKSEIGAAERAGMDPEALRKRISELKPKSKRDQLIDFFVGRLEETNVISAADAARARNEFRNDTTLTGIIK
jgi:hypothetical protein